MAERGKHPNTIAALAAARGETQYGGPRPNPHSSEPGLVKPGSYRKAARYLSVQKIDPQDVEKSIRAIQRRCTDFASQIALKTMVKAYNGDMRAVEYLTDQVDGKLAQTNINADFAMLQEMSDDELLEYAGQLDQAIAQGRQDGSYQGGDGFGDTEEAGGESTAGDQDEPAGAPADTPSV